MKILRHQSLKSFNTFGVEANAQLMVIFDSKKEAIEYLQDAGLSIDRVLVLGSGSNILFTGSYKGIILKFAEKGQTVISENDTEAVVRIAAGENWDDFVEESLRNGWFGVENLSLIPGDVGAAPVQNIGAYGVELEERIVEVEGIEISTGKVATFSRSECEFAYRNSIFKQRLRSQYLITSVTLRLDKVFTPVLTYEALADRFEGVPLVQITPMMVREAVIDIRNSKLPDPGELGNAGSFFKNPVVKAAQFEEIISEYPDIVNYPLEGGEVKLAAGWMIEKCGLKGFRRGQAGVHERQSLVLVNYGLARGSDILSVAEIVIREVKERFGIELEPEVNIL